MEDLKTDEVTKEQRKEVSKALVKSQMAMVWVSLKCCLGLFSANFVTIMVGKALLPEADPMVMVGYQTLCIATNVVFISRYFRRQMKANDDILRDRIKEILKK